MCSSDLLDNPRLVTTHLFRSRQNLALLFILVVIDLAEFVFFLSSDLSRPEMQVCVLAASPAPHAAGMDVRAAPNRALPL